MTSLSFSETSFSKSGRNSQYILGFAQYTQSFRSRSASFWNFMLPGYKIGYSICFIGTRSAISHSVIGALLCTDKTPSCRYWIFNAGYCLHCPLDFRFYLTIDILAVQLYTSLSPRRVRDFHPLERAHGAQTKIPCQLSPAGLIRIFTCKGLPALSAELHLALVPEEVHL